MVTVAFISAYLQATMAVISFVMEAGYIFSCMPFAKSTFFSSSEKRPPFSSPERLIFSFGTLFSPTHREEAKALSEAMAVWAVVPYSYFCSRKGRGILLKPPFCAINIKAPIMTAPRIPSAIMILKVFFIFFSFNFLPLF